MAGSRQQATGSADESGGSATLDATNLNVDGDPRDWKYTFQITMGSGSAELFARGPGNVFTSHTAGLNTGDIVHTTVEELYDGFRVDWTGAGDGVVYWWAEERWRVLDD